jgi:UDP-2,3-diacylglucosamine pyrophosphatase LpxH
MLERVSKGPQRVRTLFLSDIHLGTKGCQADKLLDFLRHYEAETIYLVGDIVDGWQLKSGWYWPQSHNDVVQKLLRQTRKGVRLVYIPGNHDEFLRDDTAIWLNTHFNAIRRALGLTYWSLSQWAKLKVKNAVNFIGEYEHTLAAEAQRRGVDGVICGHIHHAVIRNQNGMSYINCGDWVESCTAVVEHLDGGFEIIRWEGYGPRLDEPELAATPRQGPAQQAPAQLGWSQKSDGLGTAFARLLGRRPPPGRGLPAPDAAE